METEYKMGETRGEDGDCIQEVGEFFVFCPHPQPLHLSLESKTGRDRAAKIEPTPPPPPPLSSPLPKFTTATQARNFTKKVFHVKRYFAIWQSSLN